MTDGDDVRTRVEDALRRAASTAYEAAHGALESRGARDDPDEIDVPPRWRFRVSARVAVTATIVVAILGAMVVFLPPGVVPFSQDVAGESGLSGGAGASSAMSPTVSPTASQASPPAIAVGLPPGSVVVHVAGAVVSPGLYTLGGGARVADAVAAAGGAAEGADLDAVNLARVVVDGEQVRVPVVGERVTGGSPGADGRVNINTADAAALEQLPGVGPVLAARIAAYRDAHGPFASVDALDDVSGVGPAVLEKVRAVATV